VKLPSTGRAIEKEYQIDHRTLTKIREANGGLALDDPKLHEILKERKKAVKSEKDPATGLSWFQAHMREATLQKRRENKLADEVMRENWVEFAYHLEILKSLTEALDRIPEKLKSEFGLTEPQQARVQQVLDDARTDAANAMESYLKKNAQRVRERFSSPRHD
jgi:hypothetical protein